MEKYVNMEHLPPAVVYDHDELPDMSELSASFGHHDNDDSDDSDGDDMVLSSPMGPTGRHAPSKGHVDSPPRPHTSHETPPVAKKSLGLIFRHDDDDDDDIEQLYDDRSGSALPDVNIGDSRDVDEGELY